jgi:hypothetical protein
MCGIFGQISKSTINVSNITKLANHSKQRGKDSSGLIFLEDSTYKICRADYNINNLLKNIKPLSSNFLLGHSRLITNGLSDNQPVVRDNICVLHNGIIVNEKEVWAKINLKKKFEIDSELIIAIAEEHISNGEKLEELPKKIFSLCKGIISSFLVFPKLGKVLLFSNNGSLYIGEIGDDVYFASEKFSLSDVGCQNIKQIKNEPIFIDIPISEKKVQISLDDKFRNENLIPEFKRNTVQEKLLEYNPTNLKRCTKCILPETMPFIHFDSNGVCNYCNNYKPRNKPKPKEELLKIVEPYRRNGKTDCIVPFSGGRDSCYSLDLVVNELKMNPIAYTYDWGMVTDLGRRNISRMCAQLGVENIIIAADISKKRNNIAMNLKAWLKSPHLGMISILTSGDKHFFRHVETVKKQTGVKLDLWGVNPLEVTHFKAGFLGIKPDFEEERVYSSGAFKQLRYQKKRFMAMCKSPSYFNSSIWDTLSGEYYRSFAKKENYYHVFDYWKWDENIVNDTLLQKYDWETAIDTNTTWRIGDGTAAFYNYIYYTVAGFTEHDTFRSNQIREGDLTREEAIVLVEDENRPRYENIRWYLDTLNMDFEEVIKVINSIPKLFDKS